MTHDFTPASAAVTAFAHATGAVQMSTLGSEESSGNSGPSQRLDGNGWSGNAWGRAIGRGFRRHWVGCLWVLVCCLGAQHLAANPAIDGTVGGDTVARPTAEDAVPDVQLLYFTQASCGPCRQMQPMIEHLAARGFPIRKVDAQTQLELTQRFQVQRTPTFVLLRDGQELKRHSGVLSSYQINALLIDAGYAADQNVLTKPTALSPVVNFFDRLRPANLLGRRDAAAEPGAGVAATSYGPTTGRRLDPTAAIPPAELSAAEQLALQATARLKIEYQDGGQVVTDYGTGTVIHRHLNDILILTCGHVFRDSQGKGTLKVELDFSQGQPREVVIGQLLWYDAGAADVALVAASTRLPLSPMPIADPELRLAQGAPTFSVGCDFGQPATVRRGNYLAAVRCGAVQTAGEPVSEVMARKFAIEGRPVVGRSGGGLFTPNGELIGVCNAAVVESNEGRYSAIDNVHAMLQQVNFVAVVQQPSVKPGETPFAAGDQRDTGSAGFAATDRRLAENRRQRFLPVIEAPTGLTAQAPPQFLSRPSQGLAPLDSPRRAQAMGQSLR